MSRTFDPVGPGATQSYELVNDSQERIAVEITVVERKLNEDGVESGANAEDDFMLFPTQVILEAGSRQTLRVTWLGNPRPEQELAYRLIAEQLPIKMAPDTAESQPSHVGKMRVLLKYLGSLYIRPAGVKPEIVVESCEASQGPAGEVMLTVVLTNRGTAHDAIKDFKMTLSSAEGGASIEKTVGAWSGQAQVVILAGGKRRITFPRPPELPVGKVNALLKAAAPTHE